MKKTSDWICFQGDIIEAERPIASSASRGLMYGDGVFDTLRTYSGATLLFNKHFARMCAGIKTLGINIPQYFTAEQLRSDIKMLLDKKQLLHSDAVVRLQFWRKGSRGYLPDKDARGRYMITASECPFDFKNPDLVTVNKRRIPSESLPSDYKFTNGINYILASKEAAEKGGDDALMQSIDGWISETTVANIFWIKGNTVYTPAETCDLLPGITREILIHLIKNNGSWKLRRGQFPIEHIQNADGVWICNSVREFLPVNAIDDVTYSVDAAFFDELSRMFSRYCRENLKSL